MLPKEMQDCLRVDLLKVFRMLLKEGRTYSLNPNKLNELAAEIAQYYHSHKRNLITEERAVIKTKLRGLVSRLSRMDKLHFNDSDGEWVRVYSFNPKDEKTIDKCTVRFYLNLKFEHLINLIQLVIFYLQLPPNQSAPLMFKFPHPNNPLERYLRGPEKIILYVCPDNDLVTRLEAKIKSFPEDHFFDAIPLFTRKVKRGVGMSYDPKEESKLITFLRRVKQTDDIYLSYGQYMSYCIARSLQVAVIRNTRLTQRDQLNFSILTDQQRGKIYEETLQFVIARASEDLSL
ncbi:hypothetical protein HZC31_03395 [Candidatus Woesearchaeota archaeon]|nr:hypothetical protein [Candidatus Woesearchaeota archaeon]